MSKSRDENDAKKRESPHVEDRPDGATDSLALNGQVLWKEASGRKQELAQVVQGPAKTLEVEAKVENLDTILEFISRELKPSGCTATLQNQISIAAEEIFVNIAHYAYHSEGGSVAVRVFVNGNVAIEFEDSGIAYNPLAADDPDTTLSAEERKIGGLGIFLVKNIMDAVEYRYEEGKNILLIKKAIGPEA